MFVGDNSNMPRPGDPLRIGAGPRGTLTLGHCTEIASKILFHIVHVSCWPINRLSHSSVQCVRGWLILEQ